jgi:TatD DNase family protein
MWQLPRIAELAKDPAVVALGEMGLDYNRQFADRKRQAQFFEAQLQIAVDMNLPVVIHSREAIDDTLAIMRSFPTVRAVVHCFTGTLPEAKRILEAGYLLGFTGVVTFKKLDELREAAKIAPADQILVETDSPYLSPEPVRNQKICEPALVMHTAKRVAEVRGISLDELDRITTANAERLFGWVR